MEECATDFLNHLEKVSIDIIFHKKEEWDKFYMDNISRQNINIRGLQASWLVRNASGSLNKTETGSSNSVLDWHRKTKHEKGIEVRFTFYDVIRNRKIENETWNSVFPHDHMISYKKGHHQSKLSLQVNLSQQTP